MNGKIPAFNKAFFVVLIYNSSYLSNTVPRVSKSEC